MAQEVPADLDGITASLQSDTHVRPDAKTQRYDRQLRLWASAGQNALESAHILIVNGSATATQTLKNLVLPGIGAFTILDNKDVTAADAGSNFFLMQSSIGKKRASEQVPLLTELNESVKGYALLQDVQTFLASSDTPLVPYTMVISVDAPTKDTLQLADACWQQNIPMITVRSSGFIGSIRTQTQEMPFVETHPDTLVDLRLDAPWPELDQYAKSLDIEAMDSADHGHLPAVVIVLRALDAYRAKNDGAPPKNAKERTALKSVITSMKRQSDEENFDEANGLVIKLAKRSAVPSEIQQLFQDPACEGPTSSSDPFWLLLRAVRDFVQSDPQHLLPLTGALPDMKATSSGYIALQKLYRTKAQDDLTAVRAHLDALLKKVGLLADAIPEDQISTFVKHAGYVAVLRGTNFAREQADGRLGSKSGAPVSAALEDESSLMHFLVALRAADAFEAEFGHWPGEKDPEADLSKAEDFAGAVLKRAGLNGAELPESVSEAVQEVVRAGGADLPQIAALLGGIASQEAIKLTTRQYMALNGEVVFDGIKSRTSIL